jgi:DNA-binding MarR family transcriptional regulator
MNTTAIDDVLIAVRRVIRATDLQSKHLVKTTGLTTPQLLILQTIQQSQDLNIGQIARKISLSQATVTTIIDRLESRGLISRTRSNSDRRKVHLSLTSAGSETLDNAPPALQDQFIKQFSELKEWEQHMITAALQRVAEMMDAQNIDAAPFLEVGALHRSGGED